MFEGVEDLRIYQKAEEIADTVWEIVIEWDWFLKRTVGQQFVCAVDSIGSNIAEGFGRHHLKDSINFYYYARASLEETRYWIRRSLKRKLVAPDTGNELLKEIESLSRQVNAFISKKRTQKI